MAASSSCTGKERALPGSRIRLEGSEPIGFVPGRSHSRRMTVSHPRGPTKPFSLPAGPLLDAQTKQVMDMNEWLRAFALVSLRQAPLLALMVLVVFLIAFEIIFEPWRASHSLFVRGGSESPRASF